MIPDISRYFLDHFWNFQIVHQIWSLTPLIYHQNTLMNTRKYGNIQQFAISTFGKSKISNLLDTIGHQQYLTHF